jgi:hypothetical protein
MSPIGAINVDGCCVMEPRWCCDMRRRYQGRSKSRVQMLGADRAVRAVMFGRADQDDDTARRSR